MRYEEKYKEALERAKKLYEQGTITESLNYVFPELKESEDEKIRKELMQNLKERFGTNGTMGGILDMPKVLSWLEKQGEPVEINPTEFDTRLQALIGKFNSLPKEELIGSLNFWLNVIQNDGTYKDEKSKCKQKLVEKYNITDIGSKNAQGKLGEMIKNLKSANKVEPKFKVGDWIYHEISGNVFHINRIENRTYISDEGATISFGRQNDWRFWNIQDAKSGDVLVDEDNNIGICKEIESIYWDSYIYLGCDGELRGFSIGGKHKQTDTHPATKEQRGTLMKAMTSAGYTFDFEKKELKKIENENPLLSDFFKAEYERGKADAQKPAWSEEDKKMFVNIKACLRNANKDYSREIDWLKSLRPHSNITDEELAKAKKDAYNDALNKIEYHSGEPTFDDGWSAAIWYLKKRNIIPLLQGT